MVMVVVISQVFNLRMGDSRAPSGDTCLLGLICSYGMKAY